MRDVAKVEKSKQIKRLINEDVVFQPLDIDLFSLHAAVPLLLLKGREQNISEVFPHSCAYEYV